MSLFFFGGAALQTATATTPADIPPSVTAEDSLDGRTLTVTITDSDGNPAPTFSITMTVTDLAPDDGDPETSEDLTTTSVTPSGSGAGPWTYTVPSSALDVRIDWQIIASNTEGQASAIGSETVTADVTPSVSIVVEDDDTLTITTGDGPVEITIENVTGIEYPAWGTYDANGSPGFYSFNTDALADGPVFAFPGEIVGQLVDGGGVVLTAPPFFAFEGTSATSEPSIVIDPGWQADTLGNGTFADLSDTDETYFITSAEIGDQIRFAYEATDDNGTTTGATPALLVPSTATLGFSGDRTDGLLITYTGTLTITDGRTDGLLFEVT